MGAGLKKLLKRKDWLTVPEAARHLAILFGEDVSEADVLGLVLDRRLTLSAHFVNPVAARCGKIIPLAEAKTVEVQDIYRNTYQRVEQGVDLGVFGNTYQRIGQDLGVYNTYQGIEQGVDLGDDRAVTFSDARFLDGIWDLSMLGAERIDVEHKYQSLTGGPAVESTKLNGPLVYRSDGTWAQILQHISKKMTHLDLNKISSYHKPEEYYHPAGGLPSDAVFVVRTSALQDLVALMSEPEPAMERPIGQRERDTLLVIIAAVAKLAKLDIDKPSRAAAKIESETALMGNRVAARTIENHLNRIREARDSKAED